MTAFLGRGIDASAPRPADPIWLSFTFGASGLPATVRFRENPSRQDETCLTLAISRVALVRLGGRAPIEQDKLGYHLPARLRAIALALRQCDLPEEPRVVYRLAKCLELVCETIRMQYDALLVPAAPEGSLSLADSHRLIEARRMIDERWHEKLTLNAISRACGLNRNKLTRGFRALFDCSVAEALAERRLEQASRMLLATDLPVSSVGYESGYLNNASFARAFGRRFGVSPSEYRVGRAAA